MTTPDHAHDLEAFDGCRGSLHGLEPTSGTDDLLERAMVRFDDIVQVLRRSVLCGCGELALPFQPFNRFWVGAKLVGSDGGSRPVPHGCEGFAEETVCCTCVSTLQEHEVDQHAMLVDSSEQILPSAAHLDVGLVDAPQG